MGPSGSDTVKDVCRGSFLYSTDYVLCVEAYSILLIDKFIIVTLVYFIKCSLHFICPLFYIY